MNKFKRALLTLRFRFGLYISLLKRGDFPPKGWTSFFIRIGIIGMVVAGYTYA